MEVFESKSQSQGQYSHIISENVEGFQQRINEIHNLFDQDEDFSKITAEIYKSKKSELRKLVTELSGLHMALADQNVHLVEEVSKNTHTTTTPIKTQHVDSSTSTSTQVSPTDKTDNDASSSEHLNSPVKNDASKVKEANVHDPDALLEKISDLEKEAVGLWEQIQNLTDENEIHEAEKAKVADLKLTIETMGKEIEGSRKQVLTAEDEISKLKEEQTELLRTIESIDQKSALLTEQLGLQQNRESELEEKVELALAEIANRDEQIAELKTQIDELGISHAAEENRWNTEMKRLKTDLRRNYDREVSALKKEKNNLTEENAMIEPMKANVAELTKTISECNRKIETSEKVLESYRKKLFTADDENSKLYEENSKLEQELSTKVRDLTGKIDSIENEYENAKLGLAEIGNRDEQIAELNSQIYLLKISHAAKEDELNTEISKLKEALSSKDFDLTLKIENQFGEKVKLGLAEIAKRDEHIAELKTQIDLLKNSDADEEDREKLKKKLEKWYEIEEVDL